jgi:hypothetical protein
MEDLSKKVDKFIEDLKDKENDLQQKIKFCKEHKFEKEVEWLRMQYKIINEIRFELEFLKIETGFLQN